MAEAFLDVYLASIPHTEAEPYFSVSKVDVFANVDHVERREELLQIRCERLRAEKYYVWRLLECALFERFGKSASELSVTKKVGGGWFSPFCEISLSHSDGGLAVAISSAPVGVDIEPIEPSRVKKFVQKSLTAAENLVYRELAPEEKALQALRFWVMKESIFKMKGAECFLPSGIDTVGSDAVKCFERELDGRKYFLSVASEISKALKIIVLKKI